MKRTILTIACAAIFFGGAASAAYVRSTAAKYSHSAPCGKLAGFEGLLQKAHFIGGADCAVNVRHFCAAPGSACTVQQIPPGATTDQGVCTNTTQNLNSPCQCVVNN